jgi:Mce-associated membrane protein
MTDLNLPSTHTTSAPWWRSTLVLALLVGALLVGGGVTAFVLLNGDDSGDTASADLVAPGVLVAAREEATAFFSLDYRHPDDDIKRVLALATGDFKKQYDANKAQVIAQLTAKKLVTTASIPKDGVAVEFAHGNDARVLVVVDVTRTIGSTTDSLRNRARIVLTRVGGHWLVSGVNQVG